MQRCGVRPTLGRHCSGRARDQYYPPKQHFDTDARDTCARRHEVFTGCGRGRRKVMVGTVSAMLAPRVLEQLATRNRDHQALLNALCW